MIMPRSIADFPDARDRGGETGSAPPREVLEFEKPDERILILAPTGQDALLASSFLSEAGLSTHVCRNMFDLSLKVEAGCGAVVVAEESLNTTSVEVLVNMLARQPSWSDIPIVIITSGGEMTS